MKSAGCKEIAGNLGVQIVTDIPREEYTVVIDAVFGVGLSRPVTGRYAEVIKAMNQKKGQKVAVDVPSGISSFDGSVLGVAFRADLTVSFACEKLGSVLFPGYEYSGGSSSCRDWDRDRYFSETDGYLLYTGQGRSF